MKASRRRILVWGVLLGVLVLGIGFAFRPTPVAVDLTAVTQGPLVVTADEEGETRIRDVFVLSSPITGHALRIDAEAGDQVFAGETVIARIEPLDPEFLDVRTEAEAEAAVSAAAAARTLAAAQLEEALAELDFAESELSRARRLINTQTISERALDNAEREFRTRTAAVSTAQAALEMRDFELAEARARLVSPVESLDMRGSCECVPIFANVDGQILQVLHESEGVVRAGEPLVEIGDPGDLEIVADYLSTDAVQIEPGQAVLIDEWGGAAALAGQVQRVEPFGFTKVSALGIEEQRVNVVIDLTDPADKWQRLGHGYRVEARVILWQAEEVVQLPLTALFRDGADWLTFVEEDGRATRRPVTLGRTNGLQAEILDGVVVGEQVVLHPSDRVVDGTRIIARGDA